jgi:hypothetical protein
MLTHPTLDKLIALRLTGMAKAFEEQLQMTGIEELGFSERLGLLVDREMTERDNRRLHNRLARARLRQAAVVEDIDFRAPRGLDRQLFDAFITKWSKLCPPVARSLAEGGLELLTFFEFPKSMWKSLRTTNALENLNRELRRRTKTQASFSTEEAAVTLLYGLVAFGQIKLRKVDGHRDLAALVAEGQRQAA